MLKIAIAASLIGLSGCAPVMLATNASSNEEQVRAETAQYFGVAQSRVRISNYEKGLFGTGYQARVNGDLYNCSFYLNNVDCKRPGQSIF